ncbi:transposase [Paracoccus benzoatiresistens]|uniref:transposase n=1 Tax=Paracoccus benzoatiresistens TaxID=2997341 RepID=UPI00353045A0
MTADLRRICNAPCTDRDAAELDTIVEKGTAKSASITPAWCRARAEVIPFLAFGPAIRKVARATNAIESLNSAIRSSIRTRNPFTADDFATKLIHMAICSFGRAAHRPGRGCGAQAVGHDVRRALGARAYPKPHEPGEVHKVSGTHRNTPRPLPASCLSAIAPPQRSRSGPESAGRSLISRYACRLLTPTSPSPRDLIAATAAMLPAAVVKYGILS